jgi:hypothetical protein
MPSAIRSLVLEWTRDAQALGTSEGKIHLLRNPQFKQREMLRSTDARNDKVQILQLLRIDLYQRAGKEVCLLLIVSFQDNTVSAVHERFERIDDLLLRENRTLHPGPNTLDAATLFVPPCCPGVRCALLVFIDHWFLRVPRIRPGCDLH